MSMSRAWAVVLCEHTIQKKYSEDAIGGPPPLAPLWVRQWSYLISYELLTVNRPLFSARVVVMMLQTLGSCLKAPRAATWAGSQTSSWTPRCG